MSKQTGIAFSCSHVPLHDQGAKEWLLSQVEELKPDWVIHLGDLFEADSASRWPSEYDWTLSYELIDGNDYLRDVREAAEAVNPDTRCVLLTGNHDDNIICLNRIDKKLRDLCDWRNHELVPEVRDRRWMLGASYEKHRERGAFRLGQVTLCHGYEAGQSADKFQSVRMGVPYGVYIGGHTHRPCRVTQVAMTATCPLPYWYANAGTLRDIDDVPYMKRKDRMKWGQGVVAFEFDTWRYDKGYFPLERLWDAELRLYRMYDESVTP